MAKLEQYSNRVLQGQVIVVKEKIDILKHDISIFEKAKKEEDAEALKHMLAERELYLKAIEEELKSRGNG